MAYYYGFEGDNDLEAAVVLGCRPKKDEQLYYELLEPMNLEHFLTHVKKVVRAGNPIYGFKIPLKWANTKPTDWPQYDTLVKIAARYGWHKPEIYLCIAQDAGIHYEDMPVIGKIDKKPGTYHKLREGLEWMQVDTKARPAKKPAAAGVAAGGDDDDDDDDDDDGTDGGTDGGNDGGNDGGHDGEAAPKAKRGPSK